MPALAKKSGTSAQLYRNTGSFASVTPSACKIQDLKFSDKPSASFDSSDRTISVDTEIPCRYKWMVEGSFIWDASDANLIALVAAARSNAPIDMVVTDDDITTPGTKGLHAEWAVTSGWDLDAKLTAGQECKFTLAPHGNYTNAPVRWST